MFPFDILRVLVGDIKILRLLSRDCEKVSRKMFAELVICRYPTWEEVARYCQRYPNTLVRNLSNGKVLPGKNLFQEPEKFAVDLRVVRKIVKRRVLELDIPTEEIVRKYLLQLVDEMSCRELETNCHVYGIPERKLHAEHVMSAASLIISFTIDDDDICSEALSLTEMIRNKREHSRKLLREKVSLAHYTSDGKIAPRTARNRQKKREALKISPLPQDVTRKVTKGEMKRSQPRREKVHSRR